MERRTDRLTRRWLVGGRVQGVGFRWFVLRHAEALGVSGWAANLPDGRVEVVASGTAGAVEELDRLLRAGPRMSRVDSIEAADIPHETVTAKRFDVM